LLCGRTADRASRAGVVTQGKRKPRSETLLFLRRDTHFLFYLGRDLGCGFLHGFLGRILVHRELNDRDIGIQGDGGSRSTAAGILLGLAIERLVGMDSVKTPVKRFGRPSVTSLPTGQ
jgi:hypothetical protein